MKKTFTLIIVFLMIFHSSAQLQIHMSTMPVWYITPGIFPTGLGWADIDGNGYPDVVVSCGLDVGNAPVVVYFNEEGTLPDTAGWISSYTSANGCLYLGDLDNDGDPDLAVASLGITNQGLPLENHEIFYNNNGFPGSPDWLSPLGNGFSCTGGDVDGDGDLDMVFGQGDWLTSHLQKTKLFINNGGIFDTVPGWETDSSYYVDEVVFADVDMDGDLDLAIGNERTVVNVGIAIFKNNGGILETTPSWHTSSVVGGRQMAFADSDNDGYLELALASPTQKFYLFDNKNGVLDTVPCWSSNCVVTEPSAVAWADVDGDGDLDLAAGSWFSKVGIFENTGGVLADTFAWSHGSGTGTQQLAWNDFDEDWLIDTVKQFQGNGAKKLFYIGKQPIQIISSVEMNGVPLTLDQYCYDLVDGWISLGFAPSASDILSIEYTFSRDPDLALTNWGQAKIYENLNGTTGMQDHEPRTSDTRLGPNHPNPLISGTSFPLSVKSPGMVQLNIYNFQGKRVKILLNGYISTGEYQITWDGTNENGTLLPNGIYFCQFIKGSVTFSEKVIISR